ncbi:hypothetical protein COU17_03555 [Candidatus Kaiserbacteria bacterium CG10_big_fil_rev_8_21_14_0_10_49_17]|uniref:DNA polymerase III delta N-terminal domain-containing protein n=1 Tax=Candidatus Kaiserbacteria bacterium CG10_big_fil_rev_8_21_14_0_10_49_17 TaxID=1974609 RepID=A0A2M6WDG4_9BACT|nr:MAG: hypothetical protein COU17_03555 [Candidatus Kaiserbacteria bacterium CG10_big_fil_rev_8_21_14_0_10_49_17]
MIYLIYGADEYKGREKARALVHALQKRKPNALFFRITDEDEKNISLDELIQSQGLFERKYIVLLDHILKSELGEIVLNELKSIAASEHVFIILEGKLIKKDLSKIEKHAEKVQEYRKKEAAKEEFNRFALTDALGARNRERLWCLYQHARDRGAAAEELHGLLFWQVKAMLLALHSNTTEEAGLKPFPYKKAKEALRNYSEAELKNRAAQLVALPHESRRGAFDFAIGLEQWILKI